MDIAMETSSDSSSGSSYSMDEECNIVDSMSLNRQPLVVPTVNVEEERDIQECTKENRIMADSNDAFVSKEVQMSDYEVPSIGKEFNSEEQAYDFYNSYARKIGFSIRKSRLEITRKGVVRQRTFVCSNGGHRQVDIRTRNVRKSRSITRTSCKARMVVRVTNDGIWSISDIECEHNHHLASKVDAFLLRSQRVVNPTQAIKITILENSGISPTEGYNCLCDEAGGYEGLGFTKVDYKNYLRTKRTRELKDGDIQAVLDYLQNKHLEDPFFFHSVQVDEEDKMTNIFWVDGRSVQEYVIFGDVVCFDTTYKTNRYGRPFAPFVGVNHHGQTIFFGVALLLDETTETYIWLFQTFLKAMSGRAPKAILTDQHAAMVKAIAVVMPETCHRLCLWHIYLNAGKNLTVAYSKHFKKKFKNVIYGPESEEEFLLAWNALQKEFSLEGNKWLADLFEIREKWALVYGRDSFCANMTTTQRSESTNSFLKRYLKRKFNLSRFLRRYDKAMEQRPLDELIKDFNSNQSSPVLWADVPMLKEAAREYTRTMYELFEEEYKRWISCDCDIFDEVGSTCIYKVIEQRKIGERLVTFDSSNNIVYVQL